MSRQHLNHWAAVKDEHEKLVRFLDWCEEEGAVEIRVPHRADLLADKYFDVDRAGLDRERRELLEAQRALNEQGATS